jgi:hypothetical protein
MVGIYLTQEGKQEIEAKLKQIRINNRDDYESDEDYLLRKHNLEQDFIDSILSLATILPVEESWESMVEGDDDYEHYIENIVCFPSSYPNGVIIEPKK